MLLISTWIKLGGLSCVVLVAIWLLRTQICAVFCARCSPCTKEWKGWKPGLQEYVAIRQHNVLPPEYWSCNLMVCWKLILCSIGPARKLQLTLKNTTYLSILWLSWDISVLGLCTAPKKVQPGEEERSGRWVGKGKTECGLHTKLFQEKKDNPEDVMKQFAFTHQDESED